MFFLQSIRTLRQTAPPERYRHLVRRGTPAQSRAAYLVKARRSR